MNDKITRTTVPDGAYLDFMMAKVGITEIAVTAAPMISLLIATYCSGYNNSDTPLVCYELSNGGWYVAPDIDRTLMWDSPLNWFSGELSADAAGITASLYYMSNLSFTEDQVLSEKISEAFHKLRAYALDHDEAASIFRAID